MESNLHLVVLDDVLVARHRLLKDFRLVSIHQITPHMRQARVNVKVSVELKPEMRQGIRYINHQQGDSR